MRELEEQEEHKNAQWPMTRVCLIALGLLSGKRELPSERDEEVKRENLYVGKSRRGVSEWCWNSGKAVVEGIFDLLCWISRSAYGGSWTRWDGMGSAFDCFLAD